MHQQRLQFHFIMSFLYSFFLLFLLFWQSGYCVFIFVLMVDILLNVLSKSLRNSTNIWVCFFSSWLVVFRWLMDKALQLVSISLVFSKRCNLKRKIIVSTRRPGIYVVFSVIFILHFFLGDDHGLHVLLIHDAGDSLYEHLGRRIVLKTLNARRFVQIAVGVCHRVWS